MHLDCIRSSKIIFVIILKLTAVGNLHHLNLLRPLPQSRNRIVVMNHFLFLVQVQVQLRTFICIQWPFSSLLQRFHWQL